MGRTIGFATVFALASMTAASAAHAGNLVFNPGFETGDFTAWTVGGTPSAPMATNIGVDGVSSDVHSGSFGVFAGNDFLTSLTQAIPTVKGATYAVSFFLNVYQADATFGEMTASFSGQKFVDLVEPTETDAFTQYAGSIVATGASSNLVFTFIDPPGFFGFDDVSVTRTSVIVPEPATLSLLAGGVAAAWLALRRKPRIT